MSALIVMQFRVHVNYKTKTLKCFNVRYFSAIGHYIYNDKALILKNNPAKQNLIKIKRFYNYCM